VAAYAFKELLHKLHRRLSISLLVMSRRPKRSSCPWHHNWNVRLVHQSASDFELPDKPLQNMAQITVDLVYSKVRTSLNTFLLFSQTSALPLHSSISATTRKTHHEFSRRNDWTVLSASRTRFSNFKLFEATLYHKYLNSHPLSMLLQSGATFGSTCPQAFQRAIKL
jgi:hypothetical protein